jgi:hypothetical protein
MKAMRFVVLSLVVLLILTVIISTFPLFQVEYKESRLRKDPTSDGDVYYYHFSTTTFFSQINLP